MCVCRKLALKGSSPPFRPSRPHPVSVNLGVPVLLQLSGSHLLPTSQPASRGKGPARVSTILGGRHPLNPRPLPLQRHFPLQRGGHPSSVASRAGSKSLTRKQAQYFLYFFRQHGRELARRLQGSNSVRAGSGHGRTVPTGHMGTQGPCACLGLRAGSLTPSPISPHSFPTHLLPASLEGTWGSRSLPKLGSFLLTSVPIFSRGRRCFHPGAALAPGTHGDLLASAFPRAN
jgi:hypothetical protein